ncbi:MAG: hypothetical protein ACKVQJ_03625 [Pyrinomonadaceae bacterium]
MNNNSRFKDLVTITLPLLLLILSVGTILAGEPVNAHPANLQGRFFGLTIDNIGDYEVVMAKLKEIKDFAPNNPPPLVRIVLDIGKDPEKVDPQYFNIIKAIRNSGLAYVMAELVDSNPDSSRKCTVFRRGQYVSKVRDQGSLGV